MADRGYITYITEEVLGHVPGITARGMFGGYGVYKDGVIFGLIDDDTLYFKVADSNRADYEVKGSHPFTYVARGKRMPTSYWLVPLDVLEDREAVSLWMEKALTVSLNARKKKNK
jgi:DNA transformation protein and related proteins